MGSRNRVEEFKLENFDGGIALERFGLENHEFENLGLENLGLEKFRLGKCGFEIST
jgi:hypothetical protein